MCTHLNVVMKKLLCWLKGAHQNSLIRRVRQQGANQDSEISDDRAAANTRKKPTVP
jgi:hypothetical protein